MKADEPESLWNYGEPEPGRQGRAAILWIGLIVIVVQLALVVWSVFSGDIREVILRALAGVSRVFSCSSPGSARTGCVGSLRRFAFYGFRAVIWGVISQRGELLLVGIGTLIIFAYLAFSPAVYAFAKRQRERAMLLESVAIGAGFLLVIASLAGALLALHVYKRNVEADAFKFAELTFRRVFINRHAAFLEEHSSDAPRHTSAVQFVAMLDCDLRQCQSAGPFAGTFHSDMRYNRVGLSRAGANARNIRTRRRLGEDRCIRR